MIVEPGIGQVWKMVDALRERKDRKGAEFTEVIRSMWCNSQDLI